MKSIIQQDKERCFICGGYARFNDPLDRHHVWEGSRKSISEKYGLTVYLHHNSCHIFGEYSVHVNAKINRALQRKVQLKAMEHYGWTEEDFIRIVGKSYLRKDC